MEPLIVTVNLVSNAMTVLRLTAILALIALIVTRELALTIGGRGDRLARWCMFAIAPLLIIFVVTAAAQLNDILSQ